MTKLGLAAVNEGRRLGVDLLGESPDLPLYQVSQWKPSCPAATASLGARGVRMAGDEGLRPGNQQSTIPPSCGLTFMPFQAPRPPETSTQLLPPQHLSS